jgi:hypothetical protein
METEYNITMIFLFITTIFIIFYILIYNYYFLPNKKKQKNIVYRKLYEHIKTKHKITSLCLEMKGYLSYEEYNIIYIHFKTQKPTSKKNQEFYNHKNYFGGTFWWEYSLLNKETKKECTNQRKLFILKMIEITN